MAFLLKYLTFTCSMHHLSSHIQSFSPFSPYAGHLRLMKTESKVRRDIVTLSPQMTNEVVILLKCDWPFRAAQHPYLFCHLCSKLSPMDSNSSLNTWAKQWPAGGGVYPHNELGSQDGQMREVWSWLILYHSYNSLLSSSFWNCSISLIYREWEKSLKVVWLVFSDLP